MLMYQVGGSLQKNATCYVERQADRDLYQALKQGEFCYGLTPRQMGKSSLLVRTRHQLESEEICCVTLDITSIGTENITPSKWYLSIISELWRGLNLFEILNLNQWLQNRQDKVFLQQLNELISDVILPHFQPAKIIIFIDEIDSILSLPFAVDDFFAFIRFCYNKRSENPEYNRLTFALFGVATPSDLIQDKRRTPFNLGTPIYLRGFTLKEAEILAKGLSIQGMNPQRLLQEILNWTQGQPFLTQKLCKLVMQTDEQDRKNFQTEEQWIKELVYQKIIDQWQSQDEPEHLKTIQSRLEYHQQSLGKLLEIYQKVLQEMTVKIDFSREQIELLLSGLVVEKNGNLQVKNPIYKAVFNREWTLEKMNTLRPYSQSLDAWLTSQKNDQSRLLRGKALEDAQNWSHGKFLSNIDYQYLAESEKIDRQETQQFLELQRAKAIEAKLLQEQKTTRLQRWFLILISLGFIGVSALGITTLSLYNQSRLNEIKAIAQSAEALWTSNQQVDALVAGIKARTQLSRLSGVDWQTQETVKNIINRAVFGIIEKNRLSGHQGTIWDVRFSPDNTIIATASEDKTVKLWKPDGMLLNTLKGHHAGVWTVRFSPNSKIIASGSSDNTIKLWKLNGTLLKTLKGHQAGVYDLAFSRDGQTLVSSSEDQTLKLWKIDGTLLNTLKGHQGTVVSLVFSPNGQFIASAGEDQTIKIWTIQGKLLNTIKGHGGTIVGLAFSPDSNVIASASDDTTVKLWTKEGKLLQTYMHDASVFAVTFSPNGEEIITAGADGLVKIWKKEGNLVQTLEGHQGPVWSVDLSPNAEILASASDDKTVKLWKLKTPLLNVLSGHKTVVFDLIFAPDSKTLVSASGDTTLKVWNTEGKLIKTLDNHKSAVTSVAFSLDGQNFLSASQNGDLTLWDHRGNLLKTFKGHDSTIWGVAFSPDGQKMASASVDKTVKLWDRSGKLIKTIQGHQARIESVIFSRDGHFLASGGGDNTVKLWTSDGQSLKTLEGHQARIRDVAFSPDSQLIASASEDNTVKLWNKQGNLLKTLTGHDAGVLGVAFSPDGQLIASAGADKTVKIWNKEGKLLKNLPLHHSSVWRVAFSPNGQYLASAGEDKTLILWNLEQVLSLDDLNYACHWVEDYLQAHQHIFSENRHLCQKYRPTP